MGGGGGEGAAYMILGRRARDHDIHLFSHYKRNISVWNFPI